MTGACGQGEMRVKLSGRWQALRVAAGVPLPRSLGSSALLARRQERALTHSVGQIHNLGLPQHRAFQSAPCRLFRLKEKQDHCKQERQHLARPTHS